MCSGVWSTKSSTNLEGCYKVLDEAGIPMQKALKDIGYLGSTPCDYRQNGLGCYFELHIEQGPKLEIANKKVGVVTAVQGMKWFSVRVSGVVGHSGTVPMESRSDALVTASKMVSAVNDTARTSRLGNATVGVFLSDTQSQATIPSGIDFVLDIRCSTDKMVDDLCAAIFQSFDEIILKENNRTNYSIIRTWGLPESIFHRECIDAVRFAAEEEVGKSQIIDMKSCAGHDAAWTSKVLVFISSVGYLLY